MGRHALACHSWCHLCDSEKLKRILSLEPSTVIEYKSHRDSLRDGSTFRNARAYVFAAKPDAAAGATAGRDEAEAEGEQTQG